MAISSANNLHSTQFKPATERQDHHTFLAQAEPTPAVNTSPIEETGPAEEPIPPTNSEPTQEAETAPPSKEDLKRMIEDTVQKAVDKKIGIVLKKLDLLMTFQELQTIATRLETGELVSNADRDAILKNLVAMKDFENYENIPGFLSSLRRIVDSFTSSYQVSAVDEVDDLYRAEISRMPDVPRWMTNHFGRVLATSTDLHDKTSKRWERLRHYSDITKQNHNPEISLLWEILTQFVSTNETRTPEVDTLIALLEHFNDQDRRSFFEALDQESNTSPSEPPDLRRLAQAATKLLDIYQVEFTQFGYHPNG